MTKVILVAVTLVGVMMSPSAAKPDLTKMVDMSLLTATDTGYRFVSHTFRAPAAKILSANETDTQSKSLQAYAAARYYQVWLAIPEQTAEQPLSTDSKTDSKTDSGSVKTPSKVLYMLDGNAAIDDVDKDTLRLLAKSETPNTAPALVFIGYQTPYRFDVTARAYDYTPPLYARPAKAFQEKGRERLNGGAAHFYELIEKQIKPWVYDQLGDIPEQEAIWGHSYGGLFVLYNLFKHPEAYQQYFSADPSLWWQNGEMINYWQAYQNLPKAQLADITNNKHKQIRLTFSHSPEQTTMPVVAPTLMSKKEFAKEVCEHFEERCSYQFYNQSHGEVFTTSLLESLKNF